MAGTGGRTVTMRGKPLTLEGGEVRAGTPAPQAQVVATDMSAVTVGQPTGRVEILLSVPSLDTPVCSLETKRFNDEAAKLPDNVSVKVISTDLPFAQRRWCGAEGVERVQALSDHRQTEFGRKYGTLIPDMRILARAAFVVNGQGVVTYAEYVPEVAQEPNYEAVLAAARQASSEGA